MNAPVVGAAVGLLAGCGLLLLVSARRSASVGTHPTPRRVRRMRPLPAAAVGLCAACGLSAGVIALLVTALPVVAVLAALIGAIAPLAVRRRHARARAREVAAAWPDAVDSLVAGVRAGMGLGEATAALALRGPESLRPVFARFAAEYRATGSLPVALAALRDAARDPVADRVVVSLSLARDVGGTDLGQLLRTLSAMLREDARMRGEIAARQSWTIAAARLAVAAPWVTLALLCTRPEAVRAYASGTGAAVLVTAALLSLFAYLLMVRIGRLPTDVRIGA